MWVRQTDNPAPAPWTPPADAGQEPDVRPRGDEDPESLPAIECAPGGERGEGGTCGGAVSGTSPSRRGQSSLGPCSGRGWRYLSDVFLLFLLQRHQDEDLLQLLVAVVDDELLKAVVLREKGPVWQVLPELPALPRVSPAVPDPLHGARWVLHSPGRSRSRRCPGRPSPSSARPTSPGETTGC